MHSFSIIIVSWNALQHLQSYLPSIAATNYPEYEIILADNASTDGSKAWVREHYPKIKIAALDHNYGYCGGNNRAVEYAKGDILLFLNNDVRVSPDWLYGLDKAFQVPTVGAAQPKIRSDRAPGYFEYAGAAGGFLDRFGYPFCRGRIFDTVEQDYGQYDDAKDIFWSSGAALAIRKKLFIKQHGFDEDFEFHMEEIDLCWRLWNTGWRIRYSPESVVFHLGGGSLPMGSPRKIYYNYRNNLKMLWKNCSYATLISRFGIRYLLDLAAALRALFNWQWEECMSIFKAHKHFWQSFGQTSYKRRRLQKRRTEPEDPHTLIPISIISEYFLKGKRYFRQIIKE